MTSIITHSCGARWSKPGAAHCAGCHVTFSSDSAFVMHRRSGECVDPSTAVRKDGTPAFQLRQDRSGADMWGLPGTWKPEGRS